MFYVVKGSYTLTVPVKPHKIILHNEFCMKNNVKKINYYVEQDPLFKFILDDNPLPAVIKSAYLIHTTSNTKQNEDKVLYILI